MSHHALTSVLVAVGVFLTVLCVASVPLIRQKYLSHLAHKNERQKEKEDLQQNFAKATRRASQPTSASRAWYLASQRRRHETMAELNPERDVPFELRQTFALKKSTLQFRDLGRLALPGALRWSLLEESVEEWASEHKLSSEVGKPSESEGVVTVTLTLKSGTSSESFDLSWRVRSSSTQLGLELAHNLVKAKEALETRSSQEDET